MPITFTITLEQYEALVALARRGASSPTDQRNLSTFLESIEKANGLLRSGLWIQWQEADSLLPSTAKFPEKWPPELRHYIELMSRPIARHDVDAVLKAKARQPVGVLVTPDPAAIVGWTDVNTYFVR